MSPNGKDVAHDRNTREEKRVSFQSLENAHAHVQTLVNLKGEKSEKDRALTYSTDQNHAGARALSGASLIFHLQNAVGTMIKTLLVP